MVAMSHADRCVDLCDDGKGVGANVVGDCEGAGHGIQLHTEIGKISTVTLNPQSFLNAPSPILVTEAGIEKVVRPPL